MIVTLPYSAGNDIVGYTTGLFSDLWPILRIVLGIILGLWIVSEIITLIRKKRESLVTENEGNEDY